MVLTFGYSQSTAPQRADSLFFSRWVAPHTLAGNPTGVWLSRLNMDFYSTPPQAIEITTHITTSNIWLPAANGYLPQDPEVIRSLRDVPFFTKGLRFDSRRSPALKKSLSADGVLRGFHTQVRLPVQKRSELKLGFNFYLLDGGRAPFSLWTNDGFIEWIHDNLTNINDPFGRREFAFNQAQIQFTDEENRSLNLEKGSITPANFTVNFKHYPAIAIPWLSAAAQMQLGFNTASFNRSLDLGGGGSANIKLWHTERYRFTWSSGFTLLYQGVVENNKAVTLAKKDVLWDLKSQLLFQQKLRNGRGWGFSVIYTYSSAYYPKKELNDLVITGNRFTSHWHHTITHLYRSQRALYLAAHYKWKQFSLYGYLREDIPVNNAPDAQTGLGVQHHF